LFLLVSTVSASGLSVDNENIPGDINLSYLPSGEYFLFVAITPAGQEDFLDYYL